MKVRILTYHFSDNYGALFQAYALREWFINRGIEAEFINYHPRYVEEGGDFDELFNPINFRKNLTIAYMRLTHLYWSLFGSREQRRLFNDFRQNYLSVSGERILDAGSVSIEDDVGLLICGSDQIWNPSVQRGLDPVYFLEFPGSHRARRISYAPSFGKAELPSDYHYEVSRMLAGLDAISAREQSGVEIVRNISGQKAMCVPDPTILLGDFTKLLKGSQSASQCNHVFCYALRSAEVIREVAETVASAKDVALLSPKSSRQRWKSIGTGITPGPVEWLRLLNTSAMVITNSFHGVALSILLNRPFIAVLLPGKKASLNERILNLLEETGLRDRVVQSSSMEEIGRIVGREIDWADVNRRLKAQQEIGKRFLEEQVSLVDGEHNVS